MHNRYKTSKRLLFLFFLSCYLSTNAQVTGTNGCAFDEVFTTKNDGVAAFTGVLSSCSATGQQDCKDATVVRLEVTTSGDIDLRLTAKESGTCDFKDVDFALFGPYSDQANLDGIIFPGGTFGWPSSNQIDCGNGQVNAIPTFSVANTQEPETPFISGAVSGEWYALILCNAKSFDLDVVIGQAWNSEGSICIPAGIDISCPSPSIHMGSGVEDITGNTIEGFIGTQAAFCTEGDPDCPVSMAAPDGADCDATLVCGDPIDIDCVTYSEVLPNFELYTQYWGACYLADPSEYMYCPSGNAATDQGYINQFFCDTDGDGYPAMSSDFPTASVSASLTDYVSTSESIEAWQGTSCAIDEDYVKKVPEAIQHDFWVFVPCSCSSLGMKITGGSFDAGLILIGTSYTTMEPVVEYVTVESGVSYGNNTGYFTPTSDCSASEQAAGGRFLRVRQYITDISQQFKVTAELNIGNGFTSISSLIVYPATSPTDATIPTPNTQTGSGFVDQNGNIFDGAGNWISSAHDVVITEVDCDATALGCVPLPVELTYFSVFNNSYTNTLNWVTASELNNDFFEVERNFEGGEFEKIGTVDSRVTNSTTVQNYIYEDKVSKSGTFYYRLRQVDLDGKFEYSELRTVKVLAGSEEPRLTVFPNPADKQFSIQINQLSYYDDDAKIEIYTAGGLLVLESKIDLSSENNYSEEFDAARFDNGVYFVVTRLSDEVVYSKFVISAY